MLFLSSFLSSFLTLITLQIIDLLLIFFFFFLGEHLSSNVEIGHNTLEEEKKEGGGGEVEMLEQVQDEGNGTSDVLVSREAVL